MLINPGKSIILYIFYTGRVTVIDKRINKRVNFNVTGSVEYQGTSCSGDIENLSMKGMYLKACKSIPVGSEVKVSINLSGASSELLLHVDGNISRSDENGIAIIFSRIDLDSYSHLRNIINYNISEEW